ncbi:hypothetical protein CPB86DRAFT_722451 [Serendipita vermifera]|nr:hypothetical protein CPB86DRAFT_722451 [Serendipita vermifera]
MGDAGSGKSSMRAVIFKNTVPDHTSQLSTTHQYEMDKFRFFNSFQLNLWDFAGQWAFVDTFLSDDGQSTMFAHASAMIYVFEVTKLEPSGRPPEISLQYFSRCLDALRRHSPNTPVFVLVQKMDLINDPTKRVNDFNAWVTGIKTAARDTPLTIFGTSIYEDSLYRAWSAVVRILVPNVNDLTKSLNTLAKSCGAVETVIFEKNTFLLVARSSIEEDLENTLMATHNMPEVEAPKEEKEGADPNTHLGQANRFEMVSGLIKGFRNGTNRFSNEPFEALRMEWADFTLVLDILTSTSYVLVIGSNKEPRINPEAICYNISRVRSHFEALQSVTK